MGRQEDGHSTDQMESPSPTVVQEPSEDGPRTAPESGPHRLFDSHLSFVWRNLRRLGVSEAQVEDAAQDVFLVVHRRWESWQVERSTLETWLFGIVLRVAHNYRRAQRRRLAWLLPANDRRLLLEAPSHADGPAEILAQREAAAIFERALTKIGEDKRAVFLMIDVEQMTVPEAAAVLGINLNTAYWRLRKARMAFRSALARLRVDDNDLDRRGPP
jgi:RNA polymerase sigma-70 factor (ECF subfamily)